MLLPLVALALACASAGATQWWQGIAVLGPQPLTAPRLPAAAVELPIAGSAGLGVAPWRMTLTTAPDGSTTTGLLEFYNVSLQLDNRPVAAELCIARLGEPAPPACLFELSTQIEGVYNIQQPALLEALPLGRVLLKVSTWAFPEGEVSGRLLPLEAAPAYLWPIKAAHAGDVGAGGEGILVLPQEVIPRQGATVAFSAAVWGINAPVTAWRLRRHSSKEVLCEVPGGTTPYVWDAPCPLSPKALIALRKAACYIEVVTPQASLHGTAVPIQLLHRPPSPINGSSAIGGATSGALVARSALSRLLPSWRGPSATLSPQQWLLPPHVYLGTGTSADVVPSSSSRLALLRALLLRGHSYTTGKGARRSHHLLALATEHADPSSLSRAGLYVGEAGIPDDKARLIASLPLAVAFKHHHIGPLSDRDHEALEGSRTFVQLWEWEGSGAANAVPLVRAHLVVPGQEPPSYSGAAPVASLASVLLLVLAGALQYAAWR